MPEALEIAPKEQTQGSLFQRILKRSCVAVGAVVCLIIVLSVLPTSDGGSDRVAVSSSGIPEGSTLLHTLELNRHGARSTIGWYDFEGPWAWADDDVGQGKLTVHGMQQALRVGLALRARYLAATGRPAVPASALTVFSTDVDRTVDTAHALLLGVLPPPTDANARRRAARRRLRDAEDAAVAAAEAAVTAELPRKCACRPEHGTRATAACVAACLDLPPPAKGGMPDVQVRDNAKDTAMQQGALCKGYQEWLEELAESPAWRDAPGGSLAGARDAFSAVVGNRTQLQDRAWPSDECVRCVDLKGDDAAEHIRTYEAMWSNAICHDADGKPYADATPTPQLIDDLQPAAEFVWRQTFAPSHGRSIGGVLLHEWLQALRASAAGDDGGDAGEEQAPPLTIYSAHDTTVFALLAALGATHLETVPLPAFAAHVTIELWQDNSGDGLSVLLRYNGEPLRGLAWCPGGACSWAEFEAGAAARAMPPDECVARSAPDRVDGECCAA